MFSVTELADRLAVSLDSGHEELRRTGESTWESAGLLLEITWEQIESGRVLGFQLSNRGCATIFIERLEVLRLSVAAGEEEVRYLRFGFNMPGDPTYFGVLCGPNSAVPFQDGLDGRSDDQETRITANTAMAFKRASQEDVFVVGAGSFQLTEGTVVLEWSEENRETSVAYEMILDAVALPPGESKYLDSVTILRGSDLNALLAQWADRAARCVGARIPGKIPTGWNDWQYYRNEKTQGDILDSAQVIAELRDRGCPLDFVQVDGGFCLHLSEWSQPGPGFPDGVANLSEKIRGMDLRFGLWLAPYIQNVHTAVVREHPEWLLQSRDGDGPVVLANSNVGESCLIDFTVPGALEWLRGQVRLFVHEWKVTWIKLDGPNYKLYRQGRLRDRTKTVSEMLLDTFRLMRAEAGDEVLIEGEGMMGLALGHVDLHRVQTDNHPVWYRSQSVKTPHAPRVYGKELIMSFLHNRWWCNHRENVILRDWPSPFCFARTQARNAVEQIFTDREIRAQLVAAVMGSGGLLLTDPMEDLKRVPERYGLISRIFPVYPHAAEMVDPFPDQPFPSAYRLRVSTPFEEYVVLGIINWSDQIRDFTFPIENVIPQAKSRASFHAFSYFEQKHLGLMSGSVTVEDVSAHDGRIIALRKHLHRPQLVGASTHLLQGAVDIDDVSWDEREKVLAVSIGHYHQDDEKVFVSVPHGWKIQAIETNACRHSVDDFDQELVAIRYQGASRGNTEFRVSATEC